MLNHKQSRISFLDVLIFLLLKLIHIVYFGISIIAVQYTKQDYIKYFSYMCITVIYRNIYVYCIIRFYHK